MNNQKPIPDSRISAYVEEISRADIPFVSYSHVTLYKLQSQYGEEVVNNLLTSYFKALREWQAAK